MDDSDKEAIRPTICVAVLCHNEERRIGACLASLLPECDGAPLHVIVNGSSDRTAELARATPAPNIIVHEIAEGGKSRNWNRFVFDTLVEIPDMVVFVDGDAEVASGSLRALTDCLFSDDRVNLASAMPLNGRRAAAYRAEMRATRGLFGDLYAIKGSFLERMKAQNIRFPEDLIGDDSLIGALAKTNLGCESDWDDDRLVVCETGGFNCEPVEVVRLRTLSMQYRRMISYSVRHFQNRIISRIMRDAGPAGLPRRMASIYGEHADLLVPRKSLALGYFDRIAIARMRTK